MAGEEVGGVPELRQDPCTRDWVVLAPQRGERPLEWGEPVPVPGSRETCPFCPGREERTPPELWRRPGPDGGWSIRVVPNRYPVVTPPTGPATEAVAGARRVRGLFRRAVADGSHEVVIETPDHDWDIADGGTDTVAAVLDACRTRTRVLRERGPGLVLPFRNHGAAAGTSLAHPHSQIVSTPVVPLRHRHLHDVARAYHDDTGGCLYLDLVRAELDDGARVVAARERAAAFAPYAARTPYETWVVPTERRASFADASDEALADVAALLVRVLGGLRRLLGDVPYNYAIVGAPNGGEGARWFQWHVQIVPRLTIAAGFELGSGMAVNIVPPERAAAELRNAP
ncbi:hypothetical protein [Nonomuraea pusilla]|uniref:galactose-1-phosphate uridylyltransferase n=1 Tax=Nonomuraea pusilla TaxID=46177 RepID=UPI000B870AFB|nr:hypothetical protein [Nonomuraea pusilla]